MKARAITFDAGQTLVGLELRTQWLTLDPTGPIFGITFSRGALFRIGDY